MPSISVIEAKYKRAKINAKHTFLYSHLNDSIKKEIQKEVSLNESEIIAICYFKSANYKWFISNERLIIVEDGSAMYFSFKSFLGVVLPEVKDLKNNKAEINTICISSLKQNLTLWVEETTWHFIYMLLKFLIG